MSQFPQFPGSKFVRWYGRMVFGAAKVTAAPVLRRLYNVRLEGVEAVPPNGPAIIAPNHLSLLDPFFITLVVPRFITFIGKAEYFDAWQTRMLMEMAGVIPVRREDPAQSSLDAGMKVLHGGNLLGIFPEGTRSPDGRLYKGKTGAARMAVEVGCPILPTGLIGTMQVMPKDAKLPGLGPRVTVKFGKPMSVPPEGKENGRVLRTFTDDLMQAISDLSGQEYRHRYAYTKRVGQPPSVVNLFA
jgi:1-acyl-sn-glycerol-3-phosphate acyltransferase